MDILLKNLKVIISAGGSGIGKAILERFHAQGAKIATCDINPDLVKTLKDNYPAIYAEVLDVSDEQAVQSIQEIIDRVYAQLGYKTPDDLLGLKEDYLPNSPVETQKGQNTSSTADVLI